MFVPTIKKPKYSKYQLDKGISKSKHPVLLVIGIAFILVSLYLFRPSSVTEGYQRVQAKAKLVPSVITKAKVKTYPRIKIPSINVDASILGVGVTKNGAMDVPKLAADVGWYKLGTYPGQRGSAVLAGHVSMLDHSVAAFKNLDKLIKGDKVYFEKDKNTIISFVVQSSHDYGPKDKPLEVFNRDDGTYLNLITCDGQWDNSQHAFTNRLVVFTKLE